MKELSLHILDITQNSISAGASLIEITILENTTEDIYQINIKDNGKGMEPEFVKNVTDPFVTTRTTRKVGLGLSLLKAAAEMTGGNLTIDSQLRKGTEIEAVFSHKNIDRQPLGDISGTMVTLVNCHPEIDFVYTHIFNQKEFQLNTREIKEIMEGVPINSIDVLSWIKDFMEENLLEIGN